MSFHALQSHWPRELHRWPQEGQSIPQVLQARVGKWKFLVACQFHLPSLEPMFRRGYRNPKAYHFHASINERDDTFPEQYRHQWFVRPVRSTGTRCDDSLCLCKLHDLTWRKSCGFEMARAFVFTGVCPSRLLIRFFGLIVPYPIVSSKLSPFFWMIRRSSGRAVVRARWKLSSLLIGNKSLSRGSM